MRTKFSSELAALTGELGRLASLAHEATQRLAVAVTEADLTAAYEVFALDEKLQEAHDACENRAVILLALEAPVARDLRHVVSAMQIADDLSRIGWLTSSISDSVVRRYPNPVAPAPIIADLAEIGGLTTDLAARVVELIVATEQPIPDTDPIVPDPDLAGGCQRVRQLVSSPDWPHDSSMAVDLALLVHHYERCAEHCVRIGRLIRFFHTGIPLSAQANADSAPG
ncbi:phosphate signaling complex PhoU family protein [Nocardia pseudobrasiliensis]|uniref:Phosphate transport system protein n=1 Tax=Nocardia pseudobrasiliensis TaxID=45979 RepID=A0A370HSW3_9NOCA|nr:PhoU domain-containing protein [Nocardia pseudobrasiliensis]RDI61609.1 phosphate transport system protein [Nocardia pseudobrasiliensis]